MDNIKSGFLLINKPVGPTSHDIINKLRKITGIKKIGHAGTLDPFASGLLICAVGREATREIDKFVKQKKEYVATVHLGAVTDSYDRTGKIIKEYDGEFIGEDVIKKAVLGFIGEQLQTPPMFSAKKINGKKMYELARAGKEVERQPCAINIFTTEILSYAWPILKIKIKCSSGTYIRTIAYDLGERLGCGAYLKELERTKIGEYNVEDAINL
jgi:tRNA pseudouridine55 synthase